LFDHSCNSGIERAEGAQGFHGRESHLG
jgi:hypothetical protein